MEKQGSADLFDQTKKFIKGSLVVMIFHNESNLYSVAKIRVKETNENYEESTAVITGHFPRIHEDETYTFFGHFTDHPRFGKQYQVEYYRKELPQTKEGIIQYLSSDLFKGIGKKTAQSIVEKLGDKAISKILEDKSVLANIPKLTKDKANALYDTLIMHQGLEQVMIALSQYGFGPQLSTKIYQTYLDETLEIIESNPYQLVADVEGIGFGRADELGDAVGISGNHPDRIRAACHYVLNQESIQTGHVYLNAQDFIVRAKQLLEQNNKGVIEAHDISREMTFLAEEGRIIEEDDRYYLPSLYFAEKGFVTSVKSLLSHENKLHQFPESEFLMALGSLEERLGVEYAPSQKEAIQTALSSAMMILTGGPGTGKTTVIKGIVEIYAELHGLSLEPKDYKKDNPFPFLLVAPTGRAAKRMSETTGLPAVTIHRLLGWSGENFEHDEEHQVEGSLLIVDEFSMVDMWLANQLFKALPNDVQVVIVGDEDQLPSVGPGQVLRDILESEVIPTVRLTDIYRQSEGSSIIELAHQMKQGQLPADLKQPKADRAFFSCNQEQVLEIVSKVCQNALKKGYRAKDIQVLAPMYKGPSGIDILNRTLQQLFNPRTDQKRQIKFGDVIYRTGDKVLQLVNQPEDNVFNGDIGEIVSIFFAKENVEKEDQIVISFEGDEVIYSRQDLTKITHAYCCSIHKAQGSEFPIVVLPLVRGYYRMLRRNLIYTAVTRSKKYLILCGEEHAVQLGIERNQEGLRQTTLEQRLGEAFDGEKVETVGSSFEVGQREVHAESMEVDEKAIAHLSPYDFLDD
jgi:exodeoxyribonuclease V alpha subunit